MDAVLIERLNEKIEKALESLADEFDSVTIIASYHSAELERTRLFVRGTGNVFACAALAKGWGDKIIANVGLSVPDPESDPHDFGNEKEGG